MRKNGWKHMENNQTSNSKLQTSDRAQREPHVFDLEDRTFHFAEACRDFVLHLPKTVPNFEYGRQLIRASASPAANYIEANESLGEKDFVHKMKICRKESKECRLWLRLCLMDSNGVLQETRARLVQEASELTKIFNAIVQRSMPS